MKISIDNNKNNVRYVDKDNLIAANSNDIIKFTTDINYNNLNVILDIIAGIYSLSYNEKLVLRYLYNNSNNAKYKEVVNAISKDAKIAKVTVARAVAGLSDKSLAYTSYRDKEDYISISHSINASIESIANSKIVVIELPSSKDTITI